MTRDSRQWPIVSGVERRGAQRVTCVRFAWYQMIVDDDAGGEEHAGLEGITKTCDLSRLGIGIEVAEPLPHGALVFIEIATDQVNLSGLGRVSNSGRLPNGLYRTGIRWIVVPPNDRLLLAQLCGDDDED